MPPWGWWAIGSVGALVIVAGLVLLGIVMWRRQERRYVVRLVARNAGVLAGFRTLAEVVGRLAVGPDDDLIAFASDPTHLDRKALAEVHRQQEILHDELEVMALPRALWGAAESLAAASAAVGREAGRVGEHAPEDVVLEGLSGIDLAAAQTVVDAGDAAIRALCEEFGIEDDAAVYGGGLYI